MDRRGLGGVQAGHRPRRGQGVGDGHRQAVPDAEAGPALVVVDVSCHLAHGIILHEPTDGPAM